MAAFEILVSMLACRQCPSHRYTRTRQARGASVSAIVRRHMLRKLHAAVGLVASAASAAAASPYAPTKSDAANAINDLTRSQSIAAQTVLRLFC